MQLCKAPPLHHPPTAQAMHDPFAASQPGPHIHCVASVTLPRPRQPEAVAVSGGAQKPHCRGAESPVLGQ